MWDLSRDLLRIAQACLDLPRLAQICLRRLAQKSEKICLRRFAQPCIRRFVQTFAQTCLDLHRLAWPCSRLQTCLDLRKLAQTCVDLPKKNCLNCSCANQNYSMFFSSLDGLKTAKSTLHSLSLLLILHSSYLLTPFLHRTSPLLLITAFES